MQRKVLVKAKVMVLNLAFPVASETWWNENQVKKGKKNKIRVLFTLTKMSKKERRQRMYFAYL